MKNTETAEKIQGTGRVAHTRANKQHGQITLKKGERVIVRNTTLGGESIIEGTATIVGFYIQQCRFKVNTEK